MRLKLLLPSEVLLDEPVQKIIAKARNGSFCLEPRHIDFVAALVPGVLTYVSETGQEVFIAIDEGTLVKCGHRVLISTYNAVMGDNLETLRDTVEQRYLQLDEAERTARCALARLEAGVVRRFTQMQG
ncbi:MAG: F0F1 ATP synthase subunit epsilon [Methylobacter sp.]|uniref:ATP synthase epsilon chain n=1 Tax=Candidatus Methylobacter titanis TaxID=3053457 RepID=A0AA43Q372_9GAMM|nr:F0F1 ATP synthase subunit epsilon [Candidatus Methylobacter titanis]MDI1292909.1 F0F1 ATP synthase subunit epsilon [Candidatus Methylobacter titanis]